MTKYIYTKLFSDGSHGVVHESNKKAEYEQLRSLVGGRIEIIPDTYQPKEMKGTVFGDEEARFHGLAIVNPFMNVILDIFDEEWDVVGDLILEQTEKQNQSWLKSL